MPLKPISRESANRIAVMVISKPGIGKTSLLRTINGQQWTGEAWEQVYKTTDTEVQNESKRHVDSS